MTKYLIEQLKEEEIFLLAPGCKVQLMVTLPHVLGQSILEAGVYGGGLRLIFTSGWMESGEEFMPALSFAVSFSLILCQCPQPMAL